MYDRKVKFIISRERKIQIKVNVKKSESLRKGRNGKKEKRRMKIKKKKRIEERKEGFPIKDRKEVKREKY